MVMPSRANTIAFDFTYLHTRQANHRSAYCVGVGFFSVTTLNVSGCASAVSRLCTSSPPTTLRYSSSVGQSFDSGPVISTRTFCLAASTAPAATDTDGAAMTSTNCRSVIAFAVSSSSSRLNAMMPPKADVGSVRYARSYASTSDTEVATPHGFACLTITHAGSANTRTHSTAVSVSAMLLNESSLPWSMRALATHDPCSCGSR